MVDLIIPDVSEYQGGIDWKKLIGGGFPAAIIRAHNGSRVDSYFKTNRANAHANGIQALGMYQYLLSGSDAAAQANALCDATGPLKPGEWLICDLESGSGDQSGRAAAWHKAVMARQKDDGSTEELYSGESFYNSHKLASAGFKRIWVAAYRSAEPTLSHEEWQFTDAHSFPGIAHPCDASRFHGTISQLLTHITAQEAPVTPADIAAVASAVAAKLIAGGGVLENSDVDRVVKGVLNTDGLIAAPPTDPNVKTNPYWALQSYIKDIDARVRAIQTALDNIAAHLPTS